MSPTSTLDHRRTHNLLLISRLLNLRDNASPFTLLLDSLSQSSRPLILEYITRAQASKHQILYLTFNTFLPPPGVTTIPARRLPLPTLQAKLSPLLQAATKTLLVIDSLNPLCASAPNELAPFLSSLLGPNTSVVATFHTDVPLPKGDGYNPDPLTLLKYFATTIIGVHSLAHVLAERKARGRSLQPPVWGLEEGVDGVLVALGANPPDGVVLELEYRRKSGRATEEWFFLPLGQAEVKKLPGGAEERVMLLEDRPEWVRKEVVVEQQEEGPESTFELGLTERQRKARDEVVLPYFDAQREGGIGGGGKILFTPDREIDDFDEEEDEI
jgi:elongator complex protein 5